jgi:periplasmic protein TonB
MATQFNSDGSFNELVFENRNKEYGAYVIRKSHNETITKSLLITLSGICALLLLTMLFTNNEELVPDIIVNNLPPVLPGIEVNIKPPVEKPKVEPPKAPEHQNTQTVAFVASDDKNDQMNKTNADMNISTQNFDKGTDSSYHEPEVATLVIKKPVDPTPVVYATEMPELKNMNQFISDNLRYPSLAIEKGTAGVVYVSFVVERDGSVTDVQLLRGIGDGCEQEAMRVVKAMPKWKPGKNHGEPVRVLFNLPVKFRLQ